MLDEAALTVVAGGTMRGGRWSNSSAGSLPRSLLSQAAEEYQRLLASLPKRNLCVLAQWKMEGFTNQEIAVKLACQRTQRGAETAHHPRFLGGGWHLMKGPLGSCRGATCGRGGRRRGSVVGVEMPPVAGARLPDSYELGKGRELNFAGWCIPTERFAYGRYERLQIQFAAVVRPSPHRHNL